MRWKINERKKKKRNFHSFSFRENIFFSLLFFLIQVVREFLWFPFLSLHLFFEWIHAELRLLCFLFLCKKKGRVSDGLRVKTPIHPSAKWKFMFDLVEGFCHLKCHQWRSPNKSQTHKMIISVINNKLALRYQLFEVRCVAFSWDICCTTQFLPKKMQCVVLSSMNYLGNWFGLRKTHKSFLFHLSVIERSWKLDPRAITINPFCDETLLSKCMKSKRSSTISWELEVSEIVCSLRFSS